MLDANTDVCVFLIEIKYINSDFIESGKDLKIID
jgi:hypothetical protein